MAKSDARFEYKANLSRTDFDLSQRLGFTCAPGMELPIWYDFASPGDSFYISHDMPLLRSDNLARPAMIDVKVHYETFFVPMQMILQPFENCMFSLKNFQSTNFDGRTLSNNNFPLFDFSGYIGDILTNHNLDDIHADAFRLADLMGLMPWNFVLGNSIHQAQFTPNFFPWQLLAYHTIWMYYFRLDDKSDFKASICNWDSSYGSALPVGTQETDMMIIHQRPWDFDYFTSIYRSPIVSNQNLQNVMGYAQYSDLISLNTNSITTGGSNTGVNDYKNAFSSALGSTLVDVNVSKGISTAAIRQMFANEKLAMITGRTRKNYDSQVLAHYGVSVPHDVKHDITMIHHDEFDLNVQEVTSLAATSDATLGELAGKSFATGNGKQFKFTAPCHGVIMTLFCVEPKKRYLAGFDRINQVQDAFDFPTPEFDRLGNEPMYRYEVGYNTMDVSMNIYDIIGWQERYKANKRRYDKATYAFDVVGRGSNNWSAYMLCMRPYAHGSNLGSGVSQRPDLENRFYIERDCLDQVCMVEFAYGWKYSTDPDEESWSHSPWLVYARDPFIVNSFVKAKKVSWMSRDGEPIYNY